MKEITYRKEEQYLSPYACKSVETSGRERPEKPCPLRTDFQRDRDRIMHCKAFRRLKNKTQVFLSPEGDHYRTRLTHTLDVSQIARSIARALSLNEDLTEAIALGHDLGHTPFGHAGERTLSRLTGGAFDHSKQSLRVVDVLENDGRGLNLTAEVKDGILNHQTNGSPSTLEGKVVQLADKIAYINHDIDDAVRAGLLRESDIPQRFLSVLGRTGRERINTMILAVVESSLDKPAVTMRADIYDATYALRDFLFKNVYFNEFALREETHSDRMLSLLFDYFYNNPEKLPQSSFDQLERFGKSVTVSDYISSMTDRYAIQVFESLFVPTAWKLDF